MGAFRIMSPHDHSVLDVAAKIHSSLRGSWLTIPNSTFEEMVNWLEWRISTGWSTTYTSKSKEFDEAVWLVAHIAVRDARKVLDGN